MTNFTLVEYERRLSDLTGLPMTVEVTGRPPKEMLAGAMNGAEVFHIPAVKNLEELDSLLPTFLHAGEKSYPQRLHLVQLLQSHPHLLDAVTGEVPAFDSLQGLEGIDDVLSNRTLPDILRSVRASIGHVVFSAPELAIRQLVEQLRRDKRIGRT